MTTKSASSDAHMEWMRRAIALSRYGVPAPNPHVGCVIVRDGRLLAEGYHAYAGAPHAEAMALAQLNGKAEGADAYVTLEPCFHHGRTPPCALALAAAGVKRVWIAVSDPNPVAAGGAAYLRAQGIEVNLGHLEAEAAWENRVWLASTQHRRPVVTLKAALTADGFMARSDGSSRWISGAESRHRAHQDRGTHGAILVGAGTVRCDQPRLDVRDHLIEEKILRVVLDPRGELPAEADVFAPEFGPSWRVTGPDAGVPGDVVLPSIEGGGRLDLRPLMQALTDRKVPGLLVEGGPATFRSFMDQGLVDQVIVYQSSKIFVQGLRWEPPKWPMAEWDRVGDDVRVVRVAPDGVLGPFTSRNRSEASRVE